MDVHLVILFDGSEQVIACGHFLTIFISHEKKNSSKHADLRLGTSPLIIQERLLQFVSPVSDSDCFWVAC